MAKLLDNAEDMGKVVRRGSTRVYRYFRGAISSDVFTEKKGGRMGEDA